MNLKNMYSTNLRAAPMIHLNVCTDFSFVLISALPIHFFKATFTHLIPVLMPCQLGIVTLLWLLAQP